MSKTTCHQKNPERLNFGGSLRKLNDIDMMLGTWAHTDTQREREAIQKWIQLTAREMPSHIPSSFWFCYFSTDIGALAAASFGPHAPENRIIACLCRRTKERQAHCGKCCNAVPSMSLIMRHVSSLGKNGPILWKNAQLPPTQLFLQWPSRKTEYYIRMVSGNELASLHQGEMRRMPDMMQWKGSPVTITGGTAGWPRRPRARISPWRMLVCCLWWAPIIKRLWLGIIPSPSS